MITLKIAEKDGGNLLINVTLKLTHIWEMVRYLLIFGLFPYSCLYQLAEEGGRSKLLPILSVVSFGQRLDSLREFSERHKPIFYIKSKKLNRSSKPKGKKGY